MSQFAVRSRETHERQMMLFLFDFIYIKFVFKGL